MKMFDEEYNKTSQKLADTVMEYASQFVARGYMDEYEKAEKDVAGAFLPAEFDEKMYKEILTEVKWRSGRIWRMSCTLFKIAGAIITALCIGFTLFVLLNGTLRETLLAVLQGWSR